ncbi:MAG: FAD:protein FMN transferase [Caldilineae bacterium]|nr:MAG: FAD:protein FMN transferase [Caldilineae bacterium]
MHNWYWTGYGFRAMNTQVYAWLYTNVPQAGEILCDVQDLFYSMENRLSRFKADSELSRLNRADGPFRASPTLFDAVSVALWAAHATGGLFDPTILSHLEQAGYDRSFDAILSSFPAPRREMTHTVPFPAGGNGAQAVSLPLPPRPGQFLAVEMNRVTRTITKPPHVRLDLGGIGKGWTVDRAADRLAGLGPFLVNAGGDLYAYGVPPGEYGWEVGVADPRQPAHTLATLRVADRAVATSTIARRRWQRNGHTMHHLIDPRTGAPAQTDLLSVTVVGERVATAEVFAKVALIIGAEAALPYLESIPNVEGLLVTQDNRLLHTTGLKSYLTSALQN